MKKYILCLVLSLSACSMPPDEAVVQEERMPGGAAILAAPAVMPICPQDEAIVSDGIGGTGCR